ncbi:hypothetical protein EVAR_21120_1 [Eumeta japonica]|uniref:Uncharacterized protein n=1 Tax=Eumeta variegata TaxID=151549 RepID=A0A4C1VSJ9_EUMVA|nr:hypothetical protein EVAR_21120_1 [Eumeta japonica]
MRAQQTVVGAGRTSRHARRARAMSREIDRWRGVRGGRGEWRAYNNFNIFDRIWTSVRVRDMPAGFPAHGSPMDARLQSNGGTSINLLTTLKYRHINRHRGRLYADDRS